MKIICISGKAQNGKDTTAKYMEDALTKKGNKVLNTHYADLLKYICKTYFRWDGEKDDKGRSLLQYVGTDIIRRKSPDYWVGFLSKLLALFPDEWDYVLIADCRFPNEVERLLHDGYDVVHLRVTRPNFQSPLTPEQQNHPSETALDSYIPDYRLINDGTLQDLKIKVKRFISQI